MIEKIIKSEVLFDRYTRIKTHRVDYTRIFETLRYRLAGKNFPITHNEKKLIDLKNLHKGERAFIIGNGPSLNKCDLTLLKNEITFGVNAIYLNKNVMGFLPTYYVVEDIAVAEDRANEINSLKDCKKFFGNYLNYCIKGDENTIWLNVIMDYSDYPDFPKFSTNIARKVYVGGTVSYLCLQLAYYFGFQIVYLIGFDHSYKIPDDIEVDGDTFTSTSEDVNHFHPSYFGKGYRWHNPKLWRMELAHKKAKEAFDNSGRKIFNATIGGRLEVYERVNYYSIFN